MNKKGEWLSIDRKEVRDISETIWVKGITLLDDKTYQRWKGIIPKVNDWWWLASPAESSDRALLVTAYGTVQSQFVNDNTVCVRPVLMLDYWNRGGLDTSDYFDAAGETWRVIDGDLAICTRTIGECCFRSDFKAADANDFEKSQVKSFLLDWWKERKEW